MNKTECATQILCTILGNEKTLHLLRARFREQYLHAHPEAVQAQAVRRMFLTKAAKALPYTTLADSEELLTQFSRGHPEEYAQLVALRGAVEVDAFIDYAAEFAEKLIKRTT